MVPGARIELATPAFSGRRSTNELPRQLNFSSLVFALNRVKLVQNHFQFLGVYGRLEVISKMVLGVGALAPTFEAKETGL